MKTEIQTLLAIPGIAKAKKYGHSYIVATKQGALTTLLSHKVTRMLDGYDTSDGYYYRRGNELPVPGIIELPVYEIQLFKTTFKLKLKDWEKLDVKDEWIRPYPTATFTASTRDEDTELKDFLEPCMGDYKKEYVTAETLADKCNIALLFLQTAIPDFGGVWRKSEYAHRLGLVGDEILETRITEAQWL